MSKTTPTLFSVVTVECRGALPHTTRVAATSKAAAFTAAAKVHRAKRGLPTTAAITAVSVKPVTSGLPTPVLPW